MYDDILLDTEDKMEKAAAHLVQEFNHIRTGRATPGLVDGVKVDYYGAPTPLKQLATISIPEARLIVIKPFDPGSLKEIEKAIQKSELGVTPMSDGKLVRLAMPPLSEEQRKKLAARCKELAEAARVSIRNVRRDANKASDGAMADGALTEDQHAKLKEEVQALTKQYEGKVDESLQKKTKEIMEV
jgi:ribosome recycling factor